MKAILSCLLVTLFAVPSGLAQLGERTPGESLSKNRVKDGLGAKAGKRLDKFYEDNAGRVPEASMRRIWTSRVVSSSSFERTSEGRARWRPLVVGWARSSTS